MDLWLAEPEMAEDLTSLIDDPNIHHECEPIETSLFDYEQPTVAFGDDFHFPIPGQSSGTSSPDEWYLHFMATEEFSLSPCIPSANNNNNHQTYKALAPHRLNDHNNGQVLQCPLNVDVPSKERNYHPQCNDGRRNSTNEIMQEGNGIKKKKRNQSQVYDHIMAERKRRELLSQLFISLAAIIPGLKKIDKTSVIEEAIKHMKELQEKIKELESVATKNITRSKVVIKNLHGQDYCVKDHDYSCTIDQNCELGVGECGGVGGGDGSGLQDSVQQLEIKARDETLLLRIQCEKQKGILAKLFAELEKHHLSNIISNVVTFERLALDIKIVAKIEKGLGKDLKDLQKKICAALRP